MQSSSFFLRSRQTPNCVWILIWTTVLVSLLAPIATYFMEHFLNVAGPQQWLALSLYGIKHKWFWQPFTYFFIQSIGSGIPLSLLFSLSFQMFLLWYTGSEIVSRFSCSAFLMLYIGAAATAGLFTSLLLSLFSSPALLYGSEPGVFALLALWIMLYPDLEIAILHFIRIKTKWIAAGLLAITLLIHLSYGEYMLVFADVIALTYAFIAGLLFWKLPSPFPLRKPKIKKMPKGKIIDISSFQEDDDAFMDRMLDKITKKGESSLTKREKERMESISRRKKNSNWH